MGLYLLAILPIEEVAQEVIQWKKHMAETYNASYGLKVLPHITLKQPFTIDDSFIPSLVNELNQFGKQESPFTITLNGFGFFTGKRSDVIYVKISESSALQVFYAKLANFLNSQTNHLLHLDPPNSYAPHMTIAYRDLSTENRKKAWTEFEQLDYIRTLTINEFYLLKHDGRQWRKHTAIKLKGEPCD
ncbi:hypothetical protein C3K47_07590 [Solitalea longa]|uniref:2'-5' RNA ligase n=1 Tax=Solitalea longa TaxID=2079460 RepID=A0A2S5A2V2_9SPHI|nr:2'-5' RNA ligase family protein [Solitalea longa]POY36918.1 hypothetical protein C3K47_07590 [Solitalea longa]